jgi:hypothetical protein
MNIDKKPTVSEEDLVRLYSFLQDAAFIELNNAINVADDQNTDLQFDSSFICRMKNLVFGTKDVKNLQINKEQNQALRQLLKLDQRKTSQILSTKHGLKQALTALVDLKTNQQQLKTDIEQTVSFLQCEIDGLTKGMMTRDSIKKTINYWEINTLDISPYCQIILLIAQLKWTELGEQTSLDNSLREWVKSEIIASFCRKFSCNPAQLVPINSVISQLKSEDKIIQDALTLALPEIIHPISEQSQLVLLNESSTIALQPVLSMKRLSEQLLDGVLI